MSLYQHQVVGAQWLADRDRGYLGDVPGAGKTRTLIAALKQNDVRHPLIVCPAIVRTHWSREIDAMETAFDDVTIKSYDEIVRGGNPLMKTLIGGEEVDSMILDEAHYTKHASSKRTLQLLGRDGYAPRLSRVYAASGTPVPKNPLEFGTTLLSLFPHVALAHKIRTLADFKARFCVTRGAMMRGQWREKILPTVNNADEFRAILGETVLRRTLDDLGFDVPHLDWQIVRLDGAENEEGMEAMEMSALCYRARLAEIAVDPATSRARRRLGEMKVQPVVDMLRTQLADSAEKVVVFAHHRGVLKALHDALQPFGVSYVDGDCNQGWRDSAIDGFQTRPDRRVFLGQNIACQTGITLTAARRVILVEPDWTAKVNEQLGARIARIGQSGRCVGQMIALAGTLDEAIVALNHREVQLADAIGLGLQ